MSGKMLFSHQKNALTVLFYFQYITQQVLAHQADSQMQSANNKLLLDHHIVQQSGLLAPSSPFFQSRSITFDVSSPNILAPQPIKHQNLGKGWLDFALIA